jgi:hypothetical protein
MFLKIIVQSSLLASILLTSPALAFGWLNSSGEEPPMGEDYYTLSNGNLREILLHTQWPNYFRMSNHESAIVFANRKPAPLYTSFARYQLAGGYISYYS